jgi:hypothetical protein
MVAALLLLSGCGARTKQDVVDKAKNAKTKGELQSALGKPDDFNTVKLPIGGISAEEWKYKCSDGEVVFEIVNDKVEMTVAGKSEK